MARWLGRLSRIEKGITNLAFGALIILVFADVVSRELTGSGLHWARQAGVYANIIVVMIGLGLASDGGAHLRPRFADGWLPPRWTPALRRLQHALMAAFCVAFAGVALGVVLESAELGERSAALQIVVWPVQAVIPLAFGLASLRHAAFAVFPALAPAETGAIAATPARGRDAL